MATITYISFILCFVVSSFCNNVDICGLESIRTCDVSDTDCLEILEPALRSWFQSPYADGYHIEPVDPLIVQQLDIDVGMKKIILNGVSIKGLAKSNITIDLIYPSVWEETYSHDIELTAKNYIVKYLCDDTAETYEYDDVVTITLRGLSTITNKVLGKKERCTGSVHALLTLQKINIDDGTAIVKGIELKSLKIDIDDFEEAILERIGRFSTAAIYKAQQQLTSIVPFSALFKN